MDRRTKDELRPYVIKPDDWKDQVARAIKRYHGGLGRDDRTTGRWRPGGIAPRALTMLESGEDEVTEIARDLVAENKGKQFARYDTNEGDGLDLAELLSCCAIWGKQQRDTNYDLGRIATSSTPDSVWREEVKAIADQGKVIRGEGRPDEVESNQLAYRLDEILRRRFKARGKSFDRVISKLLHLAGFDLLSPRSIPHKIQQGEQQKKDPRVIRRLAKLERITGSRDGRVKP